MAIYVFDASVLIKALVPPRREKDDEILAEQKRLYQLACDEIDPVQSGQREMVIPYFKTGELKVESVPPPAISAGRVLVQNTCSLISAGTERMALARLLTLTRKGRTKKHKIRDHCVTRLDRSGCNPFSASGLLPDIPGATQTLVESRR